MPRKDSESSNNSIKNERNNNAANPFAKSEKVLTWFIDYMYKSIRSPDIKIDPFDTMIIKAHHNFTSHLLLTLFIFVTSHWLVEEPIICVDQSDKSEAPEDLLELCLTYPYVEYPHNNDRNNMKRRYALFYKWVHIVCLLLSFVYKGVLVPKRIFQFKNHRAMLEKISDAKLQDRFMIAKRYFLNYRGCHNNMYIRFIYMHLCALFINTVCFFGLNIAFQNYYWDLPKNLWYKRDPQKFHDAFSLIFPPFSECEITDVHHILVERSKWFGCHLTLMEFYEKIFMIFWFWQVFLGIWTILFLLYNAPYTFFFKWKVNLLSSSRFNKYNPYTMCAKAISKDDAFALRCVSTTLLGSEYAKLVSILGRVKGQSEITDPNETVYYENDSFNKDNLNNESGFNLTSYHSCSKGDDKIQPLIGFEHLGESPNLPNKFEPLSSSSSILNSTEKNVLQNPYGSWKRSLSLEFKEDVSMRRLANFDAKVSPILRLLHNKTETSSSDDSDINYVTPFKGIQNIVNHLSSSNADRASKYYENFLETGQKESTAPEYESDNESTLPIDKGKCNVPPRNLDNNLYNVYDQKDSPKNAKPYNNKTFISSTPTPPATTTSSKVEPITKSTKSSNKDSSSKTTTSKGNKNHDRKRGGNAGSNGGSNGSNAQTDENWD